MKQKKNHSPSKITRFLSLLLVTVLLLTSLAACDIPNKFGDDEDGDDEDEPTSEELIEARIDAFLTAYNAGDMDEVLNCLDAKSRNALQAMMNLMGGLLGGLTGFNLDLSDLFSLGVATSSGDFMDLKISKIEITDNKNAVVTTTMNLTGAGTHTIYFIMIYENDGWYISNMTESKPTEPDNNQGNNSNTGDSSNENVTKLSYELNNNGTAYSVSGVEMTSPTSIVIPSTYEGLPVTYIKSEAFRNCSNLVNVTIPDSITGIGSYAFSNCTRLESISLPNSITSIYHDTFNGCTNLMSITIPSSITEIEYRAFSSCYKLVEIINHSDLNIIAGSSAHGNIGYFAIKVHSGTSEIVNQNDFLFLTYRTNNYLIGYVGNDTEITLPENYNGGNYKIYKNAFIGNSNLTNVIIGNGATYIDEKAFNNCTDLTSVTIGNNVEEIGAYAFSGCSNLKTVVFTENSKLSKINHRSFENCSNLKNITIPNNVTDIGEYTFCDCIALTSVTIPDSVVNIGKDIFSGCNGLTAYCECASKPSGWNKYWNYGSYDYCPIVWDCKNNEIATDGYVYAVIDEIRYALKNNVAIVAGQPISSTTSITIPTLVTYNDTTYNVTSIGKHAFSKFTSLTNITIPDSITSIGDYAFSDCTKLTNITISKSITKIGKHSFDYCYSIKSIYYGGQKNDWKNIYIPYVGYSNFDNATRYYFSETEPTDMGNYWHYVDGEVTIWP